MSVPRYNKFKLNPGYMNLPNCPILSLLALKMTDPKYLEESEKD